MDCDVFAWMKRITACHLNMTLRGCGKFRLRTCLGKRGFPCCAALNLWPQFRRLSPASNLRDFCSVGLQADVLASHKNARLNRGRYEGLRKDFSGGKRKGPRLGTRAPKDAFRSRLFFHRGVGSSILASLSEAGKSRNKPLPPRSEIRADRHSECVHFIALCSLVTIPDQRSGVQDSLIFVDFPMSCMARLAVG